MMVAYNFQARFVPAIRRGKKTHTIRRLGKRKHAKPGDRIQLYTGLRTSNAQKIIDDPICKAVIPVEIILDEECIVSIVLGGKSQKIEQFAIADGFRSADDMHKFWLDFHGPGVFRGYMIAWTRSNGKGR
jgi:hypothetical protein